MLAVSQPTTPTADELLRVIAENTDQTTGMPVWLAVVVGLASAFVAFTVGALARGHDRRMRLNDDVRTELVRALGLIEAAQKSLQEVYSCTYPFASYALYHAVATGQLEGDADKAAGFREEAASRIRDAKAAAGQAREALRSQERRLGLLCPEGSPVLSTLMYVRMSHEFANVLWSPLDPRESEANYKKYDDIAKSVRAQLDTATEQLKKRETAFAEAAREYVQPQPTIWEQTANADWITGTR